MWRPNDDFRAQLQVQVSVLRCMMTENMKHIKRQVTLQLNVTEQERNIIYFSNVADFLNVLFTVGERFMLNK